MASYRSIPYGLQCWMIIAKLAAGVRLTVTPSINVAVNQSVTLHCELDTDLPPVIVVGFLIRNPDVNLCVVEPGDGACKETINPCRTIYNASCPSKTRYSIQVSVSRNWTGATFVCSDGLKESNQIQLSIQVPVTSVTLSPTPIIVQSGHQMNLSCETTYSNPQAKITWHMSSMNITSQSTSTTIPKDGLIKTVSTLLSSVVKGDNGKKVFCEASNTQDKIVSSIIQILNVTYKPVVTSTPSGLYQLKEGDTATLVCTLTDANPNSPITWIWTKIDNPTKDLYNGPNYTIPNIESGGSGSYSCTASNTVGASEAATITVDVQFKPKVKINLQNPNSVKEGQTISLMCIVTAANPNTIISWKWIKTESRNDVLHEGENFTISNIQRGSSGSYSCTAQNSVGISEAATIHVNVLYKPEVSSKLSSPYRVNEGDTATLLCTLTDANPNTSITWTWIKTDSPNKNLHNSSTYTIQDIRRGSTGAYNCTASNTLGASKPATINVDVLYKPFIEEKSVMIANESLRVVLSRKIDSNPLSNVSWYDRSHLLQSEISVNTTTFIIEVANCTDTKNYTIVASNSLQKNVTSLVELIVNCKPVPEVTNITLGVSDDTMFAFSTTVIAYPKPRYELVFENKTKYDRIEDSITMNSLNSFTIHFNKSFVEEVDYGTYHLNINNSFGGTTVFVNLLAKRRPNMPKISQVTCNSRSAIIQWTSSFNGGDSQTFVALALTVQQKATRSKIVYDKGETIPHETQLLNLQPSTKYVLYVVAQNKYGNSSSEKIDCETLEDPQDNLPLITGSATAGGVFLAFVVICIVVLLRKYKKTEKHVRKSQRFNNDNDGYEEDVDDGMRENILYVSAGPHHIDDEKSETTVYASVTKTNPKTTNDANIYADVKKEKKKAKDQGAIYSETKPKKGFFKKAGRANDKKDEKPKNKQAVADVYENSEDILMTSNIDDVYSNTDHNAKTKENQRGHKNKDGLLYIDVQFDGKKKEGNQIIHGENEKTDYATVEFPKPSISKDADYDGKM